MKRELEGKYVEASRGGEMWEAYWQERSPAARNALIMHFLPLVKFAALRLANRCGPMGEADDLFQHGIFGLKDAIGKFDAARGVKFETYCMTRVRGAMLDGLKSQQWLPREVKQKVNRYQEVRGRLFMEEGQVGSDEMIGARMGVCAEAAAQMEMHAAASRVMSLHGGSDMGDAEGECSHAELLADTREDEPAVRLQREDVRELFMKELSQVQRQVMMLYYYEEMTMREIGETLGISATRVSQMHTEIIARLRERADSLERSGCKMV